eukprot:353810-Chlamydomonas_euryale.AAC.4
MHAAVRLGVQQGEPATPKSVWACRLDDAQVYVATTAQTGKSGNTAAHQQQCGGSSTSLPLNGLAS